jgi:hypothetical protein
MRPLTKADLDGAVSRVNFKRMAELLAPRKRGGADPRHGRCALCHRFHGGSRGPSQEARRDATRMIEDPPGPGAVFRVVFPLPVPEGPEEDT